MGMNDPADMNGDFYDIVPSYSKENSAEYGNGDSNVTRENSNETCNDDGKIEIDSQPIVFYETCTGEEKNETTGLQWLDEMKNKRITILEAMKISLKAYKKCNSIEMKNEMEKLYNLTEIQTKELCDYVMKREKPTNYEKSNHKSKIMDFFKNIGFSSCMNNKCEELTTVTEADKLSPLFNNNDIMSVIGPFVDNKDILKFTLAGTPATSSKPKADRLIKIAKMMARRKPDVVDPFRYFVKKVSPLLLNYFDGDYSDKYGVFQTSYLNELQRNKLFDDVKKIFAPEQTVNEKNIESILREKSSEDLKTLNAGELYEYIENKTKYDPKLHWKLYNEYVMKLGKGRGCAGFAVVEKEGNDSPMGKYYFNQQLRDYGGKTDSGISTLAKCVEKCKLNENCAACTIGNALNDWWMIVNETKNPVKPDLTTKATLWPRGTYDFAGVWIKDDYSNKDIPKFSKESQSQEYARINKEIGKKIDTYVQDRVKPEKDRTYNVNCVPETLK